MSQEKTEAAAVQGPGTTEGLGEDAAGSRVLPAGQQVVLSAKGTVLLGLRHGKAQTVLRGAAPAMCSEGTFG